MTTLTHSPEGSHGMIIASLGDSIDAIFSLSPDIS